MMFKLSVGIPILISYFFCTSYALECYTCADCDSGNMQKQYCPSGDLQCGKISLSVEIGDHKKANVIKSCLPEIQGDCKSFVKDTLLSSDQGSQILSSVGSLLDSPGLNVECSTCKSDLCNSSAALYPSLFTFMLIFILSKIY